ncbi:MAG: hypothetical protein IIC07_02875 [Proteobacteria bacterium]|nr:hypothetical protein [Pseudomonadota bacterium]
MKQVEEFINRWFRYVFSEGTSIGEKNAKSPHEAYYYYFRDQLQAVRAGKWKLHLPRAARRRRNQKTAARLPARLYNLDTDIGEKTNVAAANPDVVKRLTDLANLARADLGDGKKPGKHQRAAGHVKNPKPLTKP